MPGDILPGQYVENHNKVSIFLATGDLPMYRFRTETQRFGTLLTLQHQTCLGEQRVEGLTLGTEGPGGGEVPGEGVSGQQLALPW